MLDSGRLHHFISFGFHLTLRLGRWRGLLLDRGLWVMKGLTAMWLGFLVAFFREGTCTLDNDRWMIQNDGGCNLCARLLRKRFTSLQSVLARRLPAQHVQPFFSH